MKKYVNKYISSQTMLCIFLYGFIALGLLTPIASDHLIPPLTDFTNHLAAIIEAKMALAEGQFPLRVMPIELSGFRYPFYQFYSPSTYTVGGLLYFLMPHNPILTIKILLWLALVTGGFFMKRLAYAFVNNLIASILAGVIYLSAPYFFTILSGFGAVNEVIALGLLPAVLYYSLGYYFNPTHNASQASYKKLLQISLAWYLLITVHLVTFVYSSFFIGIFLILLTYQDKKNTRAWQNLLSTGIGYGFGCLLACWFLAPVGILGKYLIVGQTFSSLHLFSPSISHLFFPGLLAFNGMMGHNHIRIGLVILIGTAVAFYGYCVSRKQLELNWVLSLFILFLLSFLLAWSPVQLIPTQPQWNTVSNLLSIGQYAWRFLGQLTWIGTLLSVWGICWLFQNKLDKRHLVIGTLLIMSIGSPSILSIQYFNIILDEFIQHPSFIVNHDAYTLEFNIYTKFVDQLDSMSLASLIDNGKLQLNKIYTIPKELLDYAVAPRIELHGIELHGITLNKAHHPYPSLSASINHIIVSSILLNHTKNAINNTTKKDSKEDRKLDWIIPLNKKLLVPFKNAKNLLLSFNLYPNRQSNPEQTKAGLSIEKIVLSGFFDSSTLLNVDQVKPFCRQEKTTTICQLRPSSNIHLIELPILYYPRLLHITLNGKIIPYQSIAKENQLLVGIIPESGKWNTLRIQFCGLAWANYISLLSWLLWLGLSIFLLFDQKRK